mmetsp:Transcript_150117/g.279861  ORF Transcript_150117/g.279861 Transcript_150117/m.279861 type:complete len:558 (-) Transcript_150117:178-1851(-)
MASHLVLVASPRNLLAASPRGEPSPFAAPAPAAGYLPMGSPRFSPRPPPAEVQNSIQRSPTLVVRTLEHAQSRGVISHPVQGTPRQQSVSSFPSPAPSCRIVPGYPVTFNFSAASGLASATPTGSVTSLCTTTRQISTADSMRQISGPDLSHLPQSPRSSFTDLQRTVPETVPLFMPSPRDRMMTSSSVESGYKDDMANMEKAVRERASEREASEMVELSSNAPAGEKGRICDVLSSRLDLQETRKATDGDGYDDTTQCSSGNSLTASSLQSRMRGIASSKWTYPARKHSEPTQQRASDPMLTSPRSRLQGDTSTRVAAAARRRKLLHEVLEEHAFDEPSAPAEDEGTEISTPPTSISGRSPSKCFDDLYVDAMERHRRYQMRVAKFLKQEDTEIMESAERARQGCVQNQMVRVPGKREPTIEGITSRRLDMMEANLKKEKQEASSARLRSSSTSGAQLRSSSAPGRRGHEQPCGERSRTSLRGFVAKSAARRSSSADRASNLAGLRSRSTDRASNLAGLRGSRSRSAERSRNLAGLRGIEDTATRERPGMIAPGSD